MDQVTLERIKSLLRLIVPNETDFLRHPIPLHASLEKLNFSYFGTF